MSDSLTLALRSTLQHSRKMGVSGLTHLIKTNTFPIKSLIKLKDEAEKHSATDKKILIIDFHTLMGSIVKPNPLENIQELTNELNLLVKKFREWGITPLW